MPFIIRSREASAGLRSVARWGLQRWQDESWVDERRTAEPERLQSFDRLLDRGPEVLLLGGLGQLVAALEVQLGELGELGEHAEVPLPGSRTLGRHMPAGRAPGKNQTQRKAPGWARSP